MEEKTYTATDLAILCNRSYECILNWIRKSSHRYPPLREKLLEAKKKTHISARFSIPECLLILEQAKCNIREISIAKDYIKKDLMPAIAIVDNQKNDVAIAKQAKQKCLDNGIIHIILWKNGLLFGAESLSMTKEEFAAYSCDLKKVNIETERTTRQAVIRAKDKINRFYNGSNVFDFKTRKSRKIAGKNSCR